MAPFVPSRILSLSLSFSFSQFHLLLASDLVSHLYSLCNRLDWESWVVGVGDGTVEGRFEEKKELLERGETHGRLVHN
ncbi:hypothetical protein Scep_021157 [Stephania cephalantha]|uniref:Uncharacterized protein n=1 Tax=Stephania cephalantha TaxID=152367 RepID=A0AAP0F809_9MAGN